MEWITSPEPNLDTNLSGICVIRTCGNKGFCDDYWCLVLNCGKNK